MVVLFVVVTTGLRVVRTGGLEVGAGVRVVGGFVVEAGAAVVVVAPHVPSTQDLYMSSQRPPVGQFK